MRTMVAVSGSGCGSVGTNPRTGQQSWVDFTSVILILVPLLLGAFILGVRARESEVRWRVAQERRAERLLRGLADYVDEESIWTRWLARQTRVILAAAQPAAVCRARMQAIRRVLGVASTWIVLDGDGNVLGQCGGMPAARQVLRRFHTDYRAMLAGDTEAGERQRGFVRGYLGANVPINRAIHDRLVLAATHADGRRCVFVSGPHRRGMVIVCLEFVDPPRPVFVRRMVDLINQWDRARHPGSPSCRVALLGRDFTADAGMCRGFGSEGSTVARLAAELDAQSLPHGWRDDAFWSHRTLTPGWSVLIRLSGGRPDHTAATLICILIVLLIAGCVVVWRQAGFDPIALVAPSIRAKLVLAFAFAAGLPIIMLAGVVFSYLSDRRQVLLDQLHEDATRQLVGIDRSFKDDQSAEWQELPEHLDPVRHSPTDDLASLTTWLGRLQRRFRWTGCELRDTSGRSVWRWVGRSSADVDLGVLRMVGDAATLVLRQLAPPEYLGILGRAMAVTGRNFVADFGGIFTKLALSVGSVGITEFGDIRFGFAMFPIHDARQRPWLMLCVFWSREWTEREYAWRRVPALGVAKADRRIYAIHDARPGWSVPRASRDRAIIARFAERIRSETRAARAAVGRFDETLILTGVRGRELREFSLVAVSSDRHVRLELAWLSWCFQTVALAVLACTITTGALLARRVLEPIGHLAYGVSCMQKRRFDVRIPVLAADELGMLARAFNTMVGDTQDLEVARVVQEGLFPDQPLVMSGWSVCGRCRSALRIGGDFLDYFSLPDGRLMIVIGDAAGHGVAAALMSAMAKVVVAHHADRRQEHVDASPDEVLTDLHRVIRQTMHGRRMMTCLVATFDPAIRSIELFLAGQNHPFIVSPKRARLLGVPSRPLGAGSRPVFQRVRADLAPDEYLVFYSDCLVETLDSDGIALDYERWGRELPALRRAGPGATEAAIRARHAVLSGDRPFDDDLSLIVLQPVTDGQVKPC